MRNGLLLRADLHRLFDQGYLTRGVGTYDHAVYSAPAVYAEKPLLLRAFWDHIEITDRERTVAVHERKKLVHAASILLGVSGLVMPGPGASFSSRVRSASRRSALGNCERKPKVWADAASNVWQSPACGFECYGMCGFDLVAIATPHNMAWAMAAVLPPL